MSVLSVTPPSHFDGFNCNYFVFAFSVVKCTNFPSLPMKPAKGNHFVMKFNTIRHFINMKYYILSKCRKD